LTSWFEAYSDVEGGGCDFAGDGVEVDDESAVGLVAGEFTLPALQVDLLAGAVLVKDVALKVTGFADLLCNGPD
jgi:hypothetical protein